MQDSRILKDLLAYSRISLLSCLRLCAMCLYSRISLHTVASRAGAPAARRAGCPGLEREHNFQECTRAYDDRALCWNDGNPYRRAYALSPYALTYVALLPKVLSISSITAHSTPDLALTRYNFTLRTCLYNGLKEEIRCAQSSTARAQIVAPVVADTRTCRDVRTTANHCMCVCIYIYIEREREAAIYIYIYMFDLC